MTNWPAPFDAIQGLFEGAWGDIINAVDACWTNIWNTLSDLWTNVVNAFANLWSSIVDGFNSLWLSIQTGFDNLWYVFWVHSLPSWDDVSRGLNDVWNGFVNAIGTLWDNIVKAFDDLYQSLCKWVSAAISDLYIELMGIIGRWDPEQNRFVGGFLGWLWDAIAGILNYVFSLFDGFGKWLTDCFDWLHSEVTGWLTAAMTAIASALLEGLKAIYQFFTATLPTWLLTAGSWIDENVVNPIIGGLTWIFDRLAGTVQSVIDSVLKIFGEAHPIDGPEALSIAILATVSGVTIGGFIASIPDICGMDVAGTGMDMSSTAQFLNKILMPEVYMGMILNPLFNEAIHRPLEYYFRKEFRPMHPGLGDAKSMLWRGKINLDQYRDICAMSGYRDKYIDGYVELSNNIPGLSEILEMTVKGAFTQQGILAPPDPITQYAEMLGFTSDWAARFWTAHFNVIDLAEAYENVFRGFWTSDDLKTVMTIRGIHPDWQDYIIRVMYKVPSTRDLGYGYDAGLYTKADLVKFKQWTGLSPDDAEKSAAALILFRTRTYRTQMQTQAFDDYVAGLDSEATLRTKLAATGLRADMIDLMVARGKSEEARNTAKELIKTAEDMYVKGIETEVDLRADLASLGVQPSRIDVIVFEMTDKKQKAAKSTAAAKKTNLTEAQIAKAWELGLIGDTDFISRLEDRNYTAEDAQLLLEIERMPAPLSADEIARRTASIQARINSTNRSYALMLLNIDDETALIGDEVQGTQTTLSDDLNVFDTELNYLGAEAATATAEKLPAIQERSAVLSARRLVKVDQGNKELTKLQDTLTGLATKKQQLITNRDGTIADLNNELAAIQAKKT